MSSLARVMRSAENIVCPGQAYAIWPSCETPRPATKFRQIKLTQERRGRFDRKISLDPQPPSGQENGGGEINGRHHLRARRYRCTAGIGAADARRDLPGCH